MRAKPSLLDALGLAVQKKVFSFDTLNAQPPGTNRAPNLNVKCFKLDLCRLSVRTGHHNNLRLALLLRDNFHILFGLKHGDLFRRQPAMFGNLNFLGVIPPMLDNAIAEQQ